MIFIGDFNVAEAPTTSLLPPSYLPTTYLLPPYYLPTTVPPTIHHLAPAKLARAAVPATPALPALPGLPGAVPRRLGAVWLTGPEDPGEAKKAVPAAPSNAAPTTVCAIASKIRRANVRLSQVPQSQFMFLVAFFHMQQILTCKD